MYRAWPANIGISENKLVITCCLPKVQKCSIIYHKGLLSINIPTGCVNSKKVCFGWKTNFCQESGNLENFLGDMKSQIFVMIFQKKTFIYTGSHYTCPYTKLFTVMSYITSCSIEVFCCPPIKSLDFVWLKIYCKLCFGNSREGTWWIQDKVYLEGVPILFYLGKCKKKLKSVLTSKWPWLNMFWKHLTCKNLQVLQGRYKISLQIIYTYFCPREENL